MGVGINSVCFHGGYCYGLRRTICGETGVGMNSTSEDIRACDRSAKWTERVWFLREATDIK
jgi:hypothetical protein